MAVENLTRPLAERAVAEASGLGLSEAQKRQVLAAAAEFIAATVVNRSALLADSTLGGAAEVQLSGIFVSLKRAGHLRGCCGGLRGQPAPLSEALWDAALRTAQEDVRFPAVSATELEHLDLEVWLLFNPQRVQASGEDRAAAVVTGGKHGLIISRDGQQGLLLPGVAAEHGWGSRRFLEQTCIKAGLHPALWKDDATAVLTFEGEVLRGRLAEFVDPRDACELAPFLSDADLQAYADFCRGNIGAMLIGAAPRYSFTGAPDGNVHGVALTLRFDEDAERVHLSKFSLRPGVALQGSLYELAQSAAQRLGAGGVTLERLETAEVGLSVFYDAALHGTVAAAHLDGFQAPRRSLLVLERSRSGLAFHPKQSAEDLLTAAARQAQVNSPGSAAVFSLHTLSTERSLLLSTAPRPNPGPSHRPPGVAGRFYPADAAALTRLVDQILAEAPAPEGAPAKVSAAMVPHAGLIYSGRIAAGVLKQIHIPRTVIVLGPKHTALGMEWAVAPHETWDLPGAQVASDQELARTLSRRIVGLSLDAAAHQQEHAIEVELPLLARLAPQTRVVGIAIGHADLESCRRFAERFAGVLETLEEAPLLLISSDMNHFATDAENRRLDDLALTALENLDTEELLDTVTENHISMCGVYPAIIVIETLKRLGRLSKATRAGYATSADVTGKHDRVVGYAGMLFR